MGELLVVETIVSHYEKQCDGNLGQTWTTILTYGEATQKPRLATCLLLLPPKQLYKSPTLQTLTHIDKPHKNLETTKQTQT